jgi:hypothetical protein
VKVPEAPVKNDKSRASKHLKKAAAISTSLDTHQLVTPGDDVSTFSPAACSLTCLDFLLIFSFYRF